MTPPESQPANLIDRFEKYLLQRKRADSTASSYTSAVRECLLSLSVDLDREVALSDLTLPLLQDWADCLPGSAATRMLKVNGVRQFLRFLAGKMQLPVVDCGAYLETPAVPPRPPKFLTVEECESLMAAPKRQQRPGIPQILALRDEAILQILWGGGLRSAELLGLDLSRTKLDLPQKGDVSVEVLGKGKRWRWVVCPRRVYPTLCSYLELRAGLLRPGQTEEALFLSQEHARLSHRALYDLVRKHGVAAGLPHVHPHLMRHCCAAHMLWGGAEICAVQSHLGHADINTTRRYASVDLVHQRERGTAHHPLSQPIGGKPHPILPPEQHLVLPPEPLLVIPQGNPRLALAQALAELLLGRSAVMVN